MDELRYRELKEKMAALKSLYASRHYSQCAKFGELLLSEIHDQTHPLHLAHLNFYTALSHDTLAREATLKSRWKELSLAELHYNAAILALAPLQSPIQCDPWSPNSSTTNPPSPYSHRRSSIASNRSMASSTTSLGDEDYQISSAQRPKHKRYDSVFQGLDSQSSFPSATLSHRPQTPQQFYFGANIASFVRMIEGHRADVAAQKRQSGVPTVRFSVPSPRTSPVKAHAAIGTRRSNRVAEHDAVMEAVRERRRNMVFRSKFDATSTQKLCNEALSELIE